MNKTIDKFYSIENQANKYILHLFIRLIQKYYYLCSMNIKEAQMQLELLESNNSLLRLLQETEKSQNVKVLIASQILNNQIQIGYLSCMVVVEKSFGAIEKKIDEQISTK